MLHYQITRDISHCQPNSIDNLIEAICHFGGTQLPNQQPKYHSKIQSIAKIRNQHHPQSTEMEKNQALG
jgi:hypothetical protein